MSPGQLSSFAKGLGGVDGIKPQHVALALSLAAATGKDCQAFISLGRLGRRCGMSQRSAATYMKWLVEKGVFTSESVSGRSNRYDLTPANSCIPLSKQLHTPMQTVADVPSKNPSYIPRRSADRALGALRLSPDTNPVEAYEPPTGGMSFSEWKKQEAADAG